MFESMLIEMGMVDQLIFFWLFPIGFILTVLLFVSYYAVLKMKVPEAFIYKTARKKKLPIIEIADTSGRSELLIGVKEKKDDVSYKTKHWGIQIDPAESGVAPDTRTRDGIPIYHYNTSFPFPISDKNASAVATIINYTRENYEDLHFLTDLELLTLIGTSRVDLEHDCEQLVEKYEPDLAKLDFDKDGKSTREERLMSYILQVQNETKAIPIKQNTFCSYTYAFQLTPQAVLSQDIHQLRLMIERKIRKEMEGKWMQQIMPFVIGIVAIMIGGAVATNIM